MNKNNHRHETLDHISKIQAGLREMKLEVCEYLKKHSIDKVPPILRPRHYILIDAIRENGLAPLSLKPQKLVKDLSSQKLGHVLQGDLFEPMRKNEMDKTQKNKIVKQKRIFSCKNQESNGGHADISCLLPNICNLKLDFEDQNALNQTTIKHQYEEKRCHSILPRPQSPENQQTSKKYHSIDLNQKTIFDKAIDSTINRTFKVSRSKWPLMENSETSLKHFRNLSYSTKYQADHTQNLKPRKRVIGIRYQDQPFPQASKKLKHFQSIKQIIHEQNNVESNVIQKKSKQFDDQMQNIEKRKIYSKINRQLQKRLKHKFPNLGTIPSKQKISLNFSNKRNVKNDNKKLPNNMQLFEPWEDDQQQKEKPQFVFQNNIF